MKLHFDPPAEHSYIRLLSSDFCPLLSNLCPLTSVLCLLTFGCEFLDLGLIEFIETF